MKYGQYNSINSIRHFHGRKYEHYKFMIRPCITKEAIDMTDICMLLNRMTIKIPPETFITAIQIYDHLTFLFIYMVAILARQYILSFLVDA